MVSVVATPYILLAVDNGINTNMKGDILKVSKMNDLQVFKNEQFGQVRVIEQDGEPWFVGKDVAEILGYENPQKAIRDHVDDEDRMGERNVTPSVTDSLGREQYPVLINESGLYSLVMSSKLPQAKAFKRWVTHDVIPSIRKHGAYIKYY